MTDPLLDIVKLLIAVFIGCFVGYERRKSGKPVGMRTLAVVCAGSTFITVISMNAFPEDTARILAGIVTGIGFLGAGSIIAEGNHVKGLTTSAAIWAIAILGVGVGLGEFLLSGISAVLFYLILEMKER
jgi:putative Mg2+ transporter-C (MgtC) family protein